jgi:hypothetical protein
MKKLTNKEKVIKMIRPIIIGDIIFWSMELRNSFETPKRKGKK